MKPRLFLPLLLVVLTIDLPALTGVHLSKIALLRVSHALDKLITPRKRRQLITNPQQYLPLNLKNKKIDVPIPTNIGHFPGGGQPIDKCERDEVMMEQGSCQKLLTEGNCKYNKEVILDPQTNKGFCAPRICPPDRVFVPATQLCHDHRDMDVCPPGRELYYSAYGTGVCACPDGTVEGDDDLDDDVCEVVLGESLQCQPGQISDSIEHETETETETEDEIKHERKLSLGTKQVYWFRDFNSPPQCLPDPCNGANLNRDPNSLPFVPSANGKCFQLGQSQGVCPNGQYYVLAIDHLRGECSTLEDAGYNVFDPQELQALKNMFQNTFNIRSNPPIQTISDGHHSSSGPQGNFSGIVNTQANAIPQNKVKNPQENFARGEHGQGNNFGFNNNQEHQGGNPNRGFNQQNNRRNQDQRRNGHSLEGPFNPQNRNNVNQVQSNQPNVNQPFNPQNVQGQPANGQANNKQICTFIQATGQKRCTDIQGNQPFNSLESVGPGSLNSHSPEVNGGPSPPFSFEQSSPSFDSYGYRFGRSLGFKPIRAILTKHFTILPNGERITHLQSVSRNRRAIPDDPFTSLQASLLSEESLLSGKVLSRRKRNLLSYASPSNVFETRLLGCRPGAVRDINAKCRDTILPARVPKTRGTRAAPPVPPTPSCPNGMAFNIRRQCVPATSAQNNLIAFNLG